MAYNIKNLMRIRLFLHLSKKSLHYANYGTQSDCFNTSNTTKVGFANNAAPVGHLVNGGEIHMENGLPIINIELPSRKEICQFIMRPLSDTVGSLSEALQNEDSGIEVVTFYNPEGARISKSTRIQHLLRLPSFNIRINDVYFKFTTNGSIFKNNEKLTNLDEIKSKVFSLYNLFNVDEYKLLLENSLKEDIENVERQLRPLTIVRSIIEKECEEHTQRVFWAGFSAICFQVGVFGRLTWWEYSWDIMEPITYFSTFSSAIIALSYYIVTKQNFEYTSAHSRVLRNDFYKRACKYSFDVKRYNELQKLKKDLLSELQQLQHPFSQPASVSICRMSFLESKN